MALRLDDLDYLLAVAQHGQVQRAADALGVSQPAVTKGIQRLERELGFALFERGPRGMALTAPGRRFHEGSAGIRQTLDRAAKDAADLHLGAQGVLRVGVSPLYARSLFVPACLQLHRQRPAARLQVTVHLQDVLLAALRSGDIDLSLHALPDPLPPDLRAHALMADDLCLVVRQGHPLLERARLALQDLVQAQWMLPGPDVPARRRIEQLFAQAGLPPPRVAVEVSSTAAPLQDLLLHSDLIAIQSQAQLDSRLGRQVAVLPVPGTRLQRQIGVLQLRERTLPPLGERFWEILVGAGYASTERSARR